MLLTSVPKTFDEFHINTHQQKMRFKPTHDKSFHFSHTISNLDTGATTDMVGHLDAVTCLTTLVAFVSAC